MKTSRQTKMTLAAMLVLSLTLVGCSSESQDQTDVEQEQTQVEQEQTGIDPGEAGDVAYPITIKHAFGETMITEKPEKVAAIGWANQDTALALGVVPVGFSEANLGPVDENGMLPWTAEKHKELTEENAVVYKDGTGVIDFEAISNSNPDVILAGYHGFTEEDYKLLSEIAPVVAYPELAWGTAWRDQILVNSKGMGMEEEGKAYVEKLETLIEEKTSEYPELDDVTGAFIWVNAADLSSFYLYTPLDTRAGYLEDLGVEFPEELAAQLSDSVFFETISAENVDLLNDLDILVTYGDASSLEAMQNDPMFSTIPAVQNGAVAVIDETSNIAGAATPGALSIPAVIDEYLQLLSEAIANVK